MFVMLVLFNTFKISPIHSLCAVVVLIISEYQSHFPSTSHVEINDVSTTDSILDAMFLMQQITLMSSSTLQNTMVVLELDCLTQVVISELTYQLHIIDIFISSRNTHVYNIYVQENKYFGLNIYSANNTIIKNATAMHNRGYGAILLYTQDTHFINGNIKNNDDGLAMFTMEISQELGYFFQSNVQIPTWYSTGTLFHDTVFRCQCTE